MWRRIAIIIGAVTIFIQPLFLLGHTQVQETYAQIPVVLSLSLAMLSNNSSWSNGVDPLAFWIVVGALAIIVVTVIRGTSSWQGRRKNGSLTEDKTGREGFNYEDEENAKRIYIAALLEDPHITKLQILDMEQSIDISNIYIQLRLFEVGLGGNIDDRTQHSPRHFDINLQNIFEPETAILKKRCVILGDAGAGKTTILKHLAMRSAKKQLPNSQNLPLYIELKYFASSGSNNLLDFVSTTWEEKYGIYRDKAFTCIENNLKNGNVILLLDGLDETMIGEDLELAEMTYRKVVKAIASTATKYYLSPIVVTARKAGYQQRLRLTGFLEMEVRGFEPKDSKEFVKRWFMCRSGSQGPHIAKKLNSVLETNTRIQALATNPLLLSLILIIYEKQYQHLPEDRASLYKKCTEILLFEWDQAREVNRRQEFTVINKERLLRHIAWYFQKHKLYYLSKTNLQIIIEAFLPAINVQENKRYQILNEITDMHGLLKEQESEKYGFWHLTFQEYFAAQQISDPSHIKALLNYSDDPWWEEVILLYVGNTNDASNFLQELLKQDNSQDLFRTSLILAGRCLTTTPIISQVPCRKEIINRLFDTLTHTSYTLIKQQISGVLAETDKKDTYPHLLHLLEEETTDRETRQCIATALGRTDGRSLARHFTELLSKRTIDKDVRTHIAEALGSLGEVSIIPSLLSMLYDSRIESEVGASIVFALTKLISMKRLEENSAVSTLMSQLKDPRIHPAIREHIAIALGTLDEPTF